MNDDWRIMWSYTETANFKAISHSYMWGSPVSVPIIKIVLSEIQEIQHEFYYFSVYVCIHVCAVGATREGGGVVAKN